MTELELIKRGFNRLVKAYSIIESGLEDIANETDSNETSAHCRNLLEEAKKALHSEQL